MATIHRPAIYIPYSMGVVKKYLLIDALHAHTTEQHCTTVGFREHLQKFYTKKIAEAYNDSKNVISKETAEAIARRMYPKHEIYFVMPSNEGVEPKSTVESIGDNEGEFKIKLAVRWGRVARRTLAQIINGDTNTSRLRTGLQKEAERATRALERKLSEREHNRQTRSLELARRYTSFGIRRDIPSELAIEIIQHYFPNYDITLYWADATQIIENERASREVPFAAV